MCDLDRDYPVRVYANTVLCMLDKTGEDATFAKGLLRFILDTLLCSERSKRAAHVNSLEHRKKVRVASSGVMARLSTGWFGFLTLNARLAPYVADARSLASLCGRLECGLRACANSSLLAVRAYRGDSFLHRLVSYSCAFGASAQAGFLVDVSPRLLVRLG